MDKENGEITVVDDLGKRLKSIVGKRVAQVRNDLGYSQPDVLKELERYGLARTQGSLSQIERGKRLPSVEALCVLAKYLETSTDYLLGLTDNALSAADIEEEMAITSGKSKLEQLMHHLSRDQKQQVMHFAEYLLAQSGRVEEIAQSNAAGIEAAMNVFTRKYGQDVADDLIDTLNDNFPDLAAIIGPTFPAKHGRANKS